MEGLLQAYQVRTGRVLRATTGACLVCLIIAAGLILAAKWLTPTLAATPGHWAAQLLLGTPSLVDVFLMVAAIAFVIVVAVAVNAGSFEVVLRELDELRAEVAARSPEEPCCPEAYRAVDNDDEEAPRDA